MNTCVIAQRVLAGLGRHPSEPPDFVIDSMRRLASAPFPNLGFNLTSPFASLNRRTVQTPQKQGRCKWQVQSCFRAMHLPTESGWSSVCVRGVACSFQGPQRLAQFRFIKMPGGILLALSRAPHVP